MRIAVLGTGIMGAPMARNLASAGHEVRAWNRTVTKAEGLGATVAATPAEALAHPTWSMGPKITIDSATLMNKGLELVEAHHLFGVGSDRLEVLIHPQSIVHGLVKKMQGLITCRSGKAGTTFEILLPARSSPSPVGGVQTRLMDSV